MPNTVDITPSPRILRTLGQIPFAPWQCIAELVDNALDGFRHAATAGIALKQRRVVVSWSTNAAPADRVVEVIDTGPGISPSTLNDCVRAGYSTNDPIDSLGLFGMGFNIATARLGEKTTILSTTPSSKEWVGIEIDFAELTKRKTFSAPLVIQGKKDPTESGTRIVIAGLDTGIYNQLNLAQIRKQLEDIYTPILSKSNVEITLQGKTLSPRPHCTWSDTRYVVRGGTNVPAVLRIDEPLGDTLFDTARNRYLTAEEEDAANRAKATTGQLPVNVVLRRKRIHGWVGIQRYSDPDDFGIDFIRNGRKILIRDKSLFSFYNPITGRSELEYPIELGSTVGGRIVGEVHIDHVPPTYQKNDFHRADASWHEMVAVLRGDGPILPQRRKAMGCQDENSSPVGRLVNAYRRSDAGTRCLTASSQQAREWAKHFRDGDAAYLSDEKWWDAAKEQDRLRADKGAGGAAVVDAGSTASDDVAVYLQGETSPTKPQPAKPHVQSTLQQSPRASLVSRSRKSEQYSREYTYEGGAAGFIVNVWELLSGVIGEGDQGTPCALLKEGQTCDFFYNPKHAFLRGYPVGFRELLLLYLAERFKVRDNLNNADITDLFSNLMRTNFPDAKLDLATVQEKASSLVQRLRERAVVLLAIREPEVIDVVHEAGGEVEETVAELVQNVDLLQKFQSRSVGAIDALQFVPVKALIRVVDRFPEEFFDGKFFRTPFMQIRLHDENATERLRQGAKERVVLFLKDALWIISDATGPVGHNVSKDDIARCEHSISVLNDGIVE